MARILRGDVLWADLESGHRREQAGLPKRSWVKISQVRTLSVQRLGRKLGRLAPEELERIIEGLNEIVAG